MITTRQVVDLIENEPQTYAGLDPHIMHLYRRWVPENQTVISGYENYALELRKGRSPK